MDENGISPDGMITGKRPESCVRLATGGHWCVLHSYDETTQMYDDAEMQQMIEFTSYRGRDDQPEKLDPFRLRVRKDAITEIEEITELSWNEMIASMRAAKHTRGLLGGGLPPGLLRAEG